VDALQPLGSTSRWEVAIEDALLRRYMDTGCFGSRSAPDHLTSTWTLVVLALGPPLVTTIARTMESSDLHMQDLGRHKLQNY
jgi:hypothetical protein